MNLNETEVTPEDLEEVWDDLLAGMPIDDGNALYDQRNVPALKDIITRMARVRKAPETPESVIELLSIMLDASAFVEDVVAGVYDDEFRISRDDDDDVATEPTPPFVATGGTAAPTTNNFYYQSLPGGNGGSGGAWSQYANFLGNHDYGWLEGSWDPAPDTEIKNPLDRVSDGELVRLVICGEEADEDSYDVVEFGERTYLIPSVNSGTYIDFYAIDAFLFDS